MTKAKKTIVQLGILVFALVFCGAVYAADDAVKVAPDHHKVVLENENVRVIDFTAKAGDKVGMHSHPNHVIYVLSSGKTKFTLEDGKSQERESKAGEAIWVDATTHSTEHPTDLHVIIVELKK